MPQGARAETGGRASGCKLLGALLAPFCGTETPWLPPAMDEQQLPQHWFCSGLMLGEKESLGGVCAEKSPCLYAS